MVATPKQDVACPRIFRKARCSPLLDGGVGSDAARPPRRAILGTVYASGLRSASSSHDLDDVNLSARMGADLGRAGKSGSCRSTEHGKGDQAYLTIGRHSRARVSAKAGHYRSGPKRSVGRELR